MLRIPCNETHRESLQLANTILMELKGIKVSIKIILSNGRWPDYAHNGKVPRRLTKSLAT